MRLQCEHKSYNIENGKSERCERTAAFLVDLGVLSFSFRDRPICEKHYPEYESSGLSISGRRIE